jgi:type IV fimbrial biogenesis protein FimT
MEDNKQGGFTLIEVMIVIGIIGILAAISAPMISGWIPNYQLKAAARDLYSAAMKAKSEAVKCNVNCALTFNQGGNAYVVYIDTNANCEFDAGETIITQVQQWPKQVLLDTGRYGGDGLSFVNNDNNNPTISFRPNALPTSNAGGMSNGTAALLNTNNRKIDVIINRAGSIRIKSI